VPQLKSRASKPVNISNTTHQLISFNRPLARCAAVQLASSQANFILTSAKFAQTSPLRVSQAG
jgi:hypothetical protein